MSQFMIAIMVMLLGMFIGAILVMENLETVDCVTTECFTLPVSIELKGEK